LLIDIETLLPQRPPFLFVDAILSATHDEIIGSKTYDESFSFYQKDMAGQNIVPNVLLIESIVQCGGAGVTQMGIFEKASWGLASLEKVRFFRSIASGSTVKMIVKTLNISTKLLKQSGMIFCEGQVVLEATWLCLRLR